jgi:hypothetical protein
LNIRDLNASGKMPPVVTWQGKQAFKFTYTGIHNQNVDGSPVFKPTGIFPCNQCRVSFSLWIDDNFPLTKTSSHKVGGKLGGFRIGSGNATGNRYTPTAATYRLTFKEEGTLTGYLYPAVRKTFTGNRAPWDLLDQSQALQSVSNIASGIHVWNGNKELVLRKGRWNAISMFCKLNTPGKYDGVMELTVNGVTKRLDSVRYRYDNIQMTAYHLETFFGGSDESYAPPQTTHAWFADYSFAERA